MYPPIGQLDAEYGVRARRMSSSIRQRLLSDPVERDAHPRRDVREISTHPQLDG